jgi:hypothetical protein
MKAEERAWEVVRRAFEERQPAAPRHGLRTTVLLSLALLAIVVAAAAVSPAGHAVFERVRRAVGVENASPTLGSLPAPGKLLVVSAEQGGTWIVSADGAKRRIGDWADAAWSPHGLYVVAASREGVTALAPDGTVRWTLPRPDVAWPVWEGTRLDTRIAYLSRGRLRVVAGDGTGDRLLDAAAAPEPPAWDPARLGVLAYERAGSVLLREADSGRVLWRAPLERVGKLVWSSDGARLAVVAPHRIVVLDAAGRRVREVRSPTDELVDAAFRPGTHTLAVERRLASRSEVETVEVDHPGRSRLLFAGPGIFGDVVWSPNGRWLLVDWPAADQWVFLHGSTVRAVSRIDRQFPRRDGQKAMLELAGRWCCAAR